MLSTGDRLGPFEILNAIGAGGMGEVYRARDAKLGRDVALKVLPEAFARDDERMARFQREAKVLASLNHHNIATVHGLEDSGSIHALVMELVGGPTLAERIGSGPIPIGEALPIAKQMCDALEYAHERGIVHRDLKPANVKVTSDDAVKVLDFGLAKALEGDAASIDIATSPTITRMATQAGVLLGTAAYMSPEQAKGHPVDRRADIWAFGCVLYEMLTGEVTFRGESVTDTLAAVIRAEPDWSQLPAATPIRVRILLQRCLQKDPKQRLQAIGDARIALDEVLSGVPEPSPVTATPSSASISSRVPMPGPAVRFDYQTFDPSSGRLYIAHMNADQLVVFDTSKRQVVANLDGFRHVHGVTLAPEIHRLYASVTGNHQVTAVDTESLKTVGTAGPINYPDGLAYAPKQNKVFVSDERGGVDAVIDAVNNKLVTNIPLGGGAGNTVYDSVSGRILVAVHGLNLLAVIDPATNQITNRIVLAGIRNPHGISLDSVERKAFVAGEENHSLAMVDLKTMKVLSTYQVGEDPDVLAYDPGLKRLYVSAESGTVTIFQNQGESLTLLGSFEMPHAHTVSVDPKTHLVYFPLENIDGHPILRIMRPAH